MEPTLQTSDVFLRGAPNCLPQAEGGVMPSFMQQQLLSSIRSSDLDSSARSHSEALARHNRELVAALNKQQTLMLQQASEVRRLRSALEASGKVTPCELTATDSEQFPTGLFHAESTGLQELNRGVEALAYSVPFQQGFLYAALDTLTTNSCTATTDSFVPHMSGPRAATIAHIRASHPLCLPPPSLPVEG